MMEDGRRFGDRLDRIMRLAAGRLVLAARKAEQQRLAQYQHHQQTIAAVDCAASMQAAINRDAPRDTRPKRCVAGL